MFTQEEIKIANNTYRSKGSSVYDKNGNIRSVVAKYVAININKDKKILDFGCGPEFIQGKYLRDLGFNVYGWDFGVNKPVECVETLEPIYDVVYASNVLNVISSFNMFTITLNQIYDCLKDGGVFIANYPTSPRKMEYNASFIQKTICEKFGSDANIVSGSVSAPLWCFIKSIDLTRQN